MKGKIIAGVIVAALVALFFVSPSFRARVIWFRDTANNWRYEQSRQAAGSQPGGAQADALATECRNRLMSAEQAKRALLGQDGFVRPGETVTVNEIAQRLNVPVETVRCPQTGNPYLLGGLASSVQCTVGNNGTPTYQADDHIINR